MTEARLPLTYYVAASLDGFIATPDGGVAWLDPFQASGDDHGFTDFFATVGALIMGSHTYEFALAHPPWMGAGRPTVVYTSRDLPLADDTVSLTTDPPAAVMARLAAAGVQHAWLLGGGELASTFLQAGLLTRLTLAVVPVVLGDGIPLFARGPSESTVALETTRTFDSGLVLLDYRIG